MKPYTPPQVTEIDITRHKAATQSQHLNQLADLMLSNPYSKSRPHSLVSAEMGIGFRHAFGIFLAKYLELHPDHKTLCITSSHLMQEVVASTHGLPQVTYCTHPRLETLDPNSSYDLVFVEATRYGAVDKRFIQPFIDHAKKVVWRLMATHKTPIADPSQYCFIQASTTRGVKAIPEKGDAFFQLSRDNRSPRIFL